MFSHVFSDSLMPEGSHDFSKNHSDIRALLEHILWHINDHKDNIGSIMYGESEKIFTRYFCEYLEKTFGNLIANMNINVPDDFKKQFVIGSFVSTVKWWISTGLKQSPGEIIDNYIACLLGPNTELPLS